jgi:hypothetical protein
MTALPASESGSVALITGASSGIGLEIARQLCSRGHDAILVARRPERLRAAANELGAAYGTNVEAMPCDVADHDSRQELQAEVAASGRHVAVLVLCAGFGSHGAFLDEPLERIVQMTRTNLEGVMAMSRVFAPAMVERREGAILIVSSIVGHAPMPLINAYAATKAGVTSFGEGLHAELEAHGVGVTVVCPGGVRTGFAQTAGVPIANDLPDLIMSNPEDVARAALSGLQRGRRVVMTPARVRAFAWIGTCVPRTLWLRACRRFLAVRPDKTSTSATFTN